MNNRPKIDEIDVKIMRALLKSPRASFTEIAENCRKSTLTINKRFNRLKNMGIRTGAITQINPKSFGYSCIADLIQTDINE